MIIPIYAPPYYKNFECIKDECRHTCCAGWHIGIDADTLSRYETMEGDLGHTVKKWIKFDEDGAYIPLTECGRCPHLDEDGLCRIISALGNEAVSEICREHPRFYNSADDRLEVGIGMSCEAAAGLILSSDEYFPTMCVGECDAENAECKFIHERDKMLKSALLVNWTACLTLYLLNLDSCHDFSLYPLNTFVKLTPRFCATVFASRIFARASIVAFTRL